MSRFARTDFRVAVWGITLLVVVMAYSKWNSVLHAQDPEPAADVTEAADEPAERPETVADAKPEETALEGWSRSLGGMIIKSGWIGVPFYIFLGILSIVALTVALERWFHLTSSRVMPSKFTKEIDGLIQQGSSDAAAYTSICEASRSSASAVLKAGLVRSGHPLLEVEKAMEDAMAREIGEILAKHQPLNVVGSIAPLVGLLGTVVGMIFAFYQSSQAGLGKAEVLAEYIYLALITTALGLSVAIPSLLLAAWFNARVDRFMRAIDASLLDMIPVFVRMQDKSREES